jgi:glycosyltransferase involved in cell wall biosynthesis
MTKPKIAIIISHPIQHFCPQYVSYARAIDFEIKVFFASKLGLDAYTDKDFGQTLAWENLNLDRFPHLFLNNGATLPVDSNLDALDLENELLNYNPDVLIVNGYFQKYQRRAYSWAKRHKKKLFYISDSENRQKRSFLKQLIKKVYLYSYFKKMDAFLSVGNANELFYKNNGVSPSKMIRVPFPVDIELYEESYKNRASLRNLCRNRMGISDDETVISVVGKLIDFKSQGHLIDAFKKIETPMVLMIIGSGPDFEVLSEKSKSVKNHKIFFPGFVKPNDLPMYYAATDIYVHPAMIEPHSLAVSEAIYMGCPIILSDRCGSWGDNDDVQIDKNGLVYPWGNIDLLTEKIIQLANDSILKTRFSEHSVAFSRKSQQLAHYEGIISALKTVTLL